MEGKRDSGALTGLFNQYKVPGQVEQSGNPVMKDNPVISSNNPVPQTDRAGNSSKNSSKEAKGTMYLQPVGYARGEGPKGRRWNRPHGENKVILSGGDMR